MMKSVKVVSRFLFFSNILNRKSISQLIFFYILFAFFKNDILILFDNDNYIFSDIETDAAIKDTTYKPG